MSKKNGRTESRHDQDKSAADSTSTSITDPLIGWYSLGAHARQAFRGKGKRKARAAVVAAKRQGGSIDLHLAGLLVLAVVAALVLLVEVTA